MPDLSGNTYSEIDVLNNQAAPNGMPEGMPPSGVNDAWRAGMGAVKRSYDRDHAGSWCAVGGTANAITLTYASAPSAYVQGEKYAFKAAAPNTGPATVNINGLGAANLFKRTPHGPSAMAGGEIQSGDIVEIEFDGMEFLMLGLPSNVGLLGGTLITTTSMSGAAFNDAFATIASAATLAIGGAPANYLQVTGATTITAFDAVQAGTERTLEFAGALTLTHNATSLILLGGANITTAAGDTAIFRSEGSGNWRCVSYVRGPASKSTMQSAADGVAYATPAQLQNHPGVAKAWVLFNGAGAVGTITPIAGYNIGSITKNGTGDYTVAFATAFANSNYAAAAMGGNATNNQVLVYGPIATPTTTTFRFATSDTATQLDRSLISLAFFGMQ